MKAITALKLLGSILVIALSYFIYQDAGVTDKDTNMPALRSFSLDPRLFNPTLYSNILKLWFEGLPQGATAPTGELAMRWYGLGATEAAKATFDNQCRSGFDEALSSIALAKFPLPAFTDVETDHEHYPDIAAPFLAQFNQNGSEDPEAALGLSLLLDQIPRNVFRNNQALIYGHYDRIARAVFYAIRKHQLDQHDQYSMSVVHRAWFYMPLMHSESLVDHQLYNQIMQEWKSKLEAEGDQAGAQYVGQSLSFEARHLDILKKFARYPYRNDCLGRQTTSEERKWLDDGGERFGT
jgi:uncharacterized protein (DUF924 family)